MIPRSILTEKLSSCRCLRREFSVTFLLRSPPLLFLNSLLVLLFNEDCIPKTYFLKSTCHTSGLAPSPCARLLSFTSYAQQARCDFTWTQLCRTARSSVNGDTLCLTLSVDSQLINLSSLYMRDTAADTERTSVFSSLRYFWLLTRLFFIISRVSTLRRMPCIHIVPSLILVTA